jgi:hypothetical protein
LAALRAKQSKPVLGEIRAWLMTQRAKAAIDDHVASRRQQMLDKGHVNLTRRCELETHLTWLVRSLYEVPKLRIRGANAGPAPSTLHGCRLIRASRKSLLQR